MDKDVKIVHTWVRERFKARRIELGLSLRQLGAKTGLEYDLIDKFESNGRDIRLSKLIALAEGLEIDLWRDLRTDKPDK